MIKYIVDEENRKVTAVMDYHADVLVRKANNVFGDLLSDSVKEKLMLRSEYRATANCDISDTFDPEIGKELAREYVFAKLEYDKDRVKSNFVKAIENANSKIADFFSGKRDRVFFATHCMLSFEDTEDMWYEFEDEDIIEEDGDIIEEDEDGIIEIMDTPEDDDIIELDDDWGE